VAAVTDVASAAPTPVPLDDLVPLLEPRDGVPAPIADPERLADAVAAFGAGTGPVAIDAERAAGYRYSARAYLVQLRRAGAGTALIDPLPFNGLAALGATIAGAEWVLHAASQDLPCLAGEGLRPSRIFDTELAGRLLNAPRVGLAGLVADVLGYGLVKGHSAADWSLRPLPEPWLRYAALDVEVLLELRDALEERLSAVGKLAWATEEFAALVATGATPASLRRADPWRRTSGLHRVRRPRQLAAVRSLWSARDRLARQRDLAPGRVLPDAAIIAAALNSPRTLRDLTALPVFGGRQTRRYADVWFAALEEARGLPDSALPPATPAHDGPPPTRGWHDRDPAAADRLAVARAAVAAIADEHGLPSENLLAPDTVRRLAWAPPESPDEDVVAAFLRQHGAREWQVGLVAAALAKAMDRISRRGTAGG
jgi:ribonuclease D